MFLPAAALNGFDPETNRRLGFAYQVSDHMREDQFLGVGSLRNSRRRQAGLLDQAETANTALAANAVVPGGYVTAVLGRLDLRTGRCALLNAGLTNPASSMFVWHPTPAVPTANGHSKGGA